ncbi:4'-phosphopantetheinyl transferase family protein [Acinetobacter sp. MD2(2019)]|uniref:4'-phosphopantetheinyl transferase family protein n=1 Tax=Acinetobacter sp. MD2(2019) TaxID=2605273 RepID=UPI002D1E6F22|nr:4'-phosphopantetheinyl transferase superfamily protein [Acinetobacter sp. MD2(2019)]MEB3753620.1 4'-phosphopantetheinyl transferase superfamily protein [Acinetobacter sp. MD2(2019)]
MTLQITMYFELLSQLVPPTAQDNLTKAELKAHQQDYIQKYRAQRLAEKLYSTPEKLIFARHELGKPYLKNNPTLAFNHSHGREHYALAISQNVADIGVDIESLQRKVRFDALAQHAFHPQEYQAWKATGEDTRFWFQVWTTKEAVLKACGLGIRMDLNQLNTQVMLGQNNGSCEHANLGRFSYQHFEYAGAMATLAWREIEQEMPEIILHFA